MTRISDKFLFSSIFTNNNNLKKLLNIDSDVNQYGSDFNPLNVKEGEVVFIKTNLLDLFFQKSYPFIKHNFIILSYMVGTNVDEKFKQFLEGESKIIKWIGTNIFWEHPKVTKIPIGFNGDMKCQNIINNMYEHRNKKITDKTPLLGIPYEFRERYEKIFKDEDYVYFLDKFEFGDYLNVINNTVYVLCPMDKHKTDTHRFWEIVFCGSIPVGRI